MVARGQQQRRGSYQSGGAKARGAFFTAEAWAPLKVELFRSLWIATSIAQIGTWVREAAGPTLMESLTRGWSNQPAMVARVLVFSNLPICLFSVFAGALADVLDRRRLLIVTQIWMVLVSTVLGLLTYFGLITPVGLLAFTFLLGLGTAAFGPALQAVLPELVPKQHFALAINMNSIALNVARAVGPALFIVVVAFVPGDRGAGVSFLLTAASFIAAAWVLWRWDRPPQRAAVHGEEMWNAIRAGFNYTIHSPANRAILLRVFTFIVPAVVIWSQVPIIAKDQLQIHGSGPAGVLSGHEIQQISALLYTFVGSGAIFGVFLMPGLHARYKIDPVVNLCTAFFAVGLIALSYVHSLWLASLILVFLGINWVIIPTNFNTATQKSVPLWVKGRAISFYLTVLFGSFAIGGAIWGRVTTQTHSIGTALRVAGDGMLALLALAYWFPLTLNEGLDLTPAFKGPPADLPIAANPQDGPVLVNVRYHVPAHRSEGFTELMQKMRLQRLRNGASRWKLEQRQQDGPLIEFVEHYTFRSWAEHTRYYIRLTKWDVMVEGLAKELRAGPDAMTVTAGAAGFEVTPDVASASLPITSDSHAATAPQPQVAPLHPVPVESISGSSPGRGSVWLQSRMDHWFDRVLDEIENMYDRLADNGTRRHNATQNPSHRAD